MENRAQILAELKEISPFIAEMAIVNPYTVPAGYFNTMEANLLEKIEIKGMEQVGGAAIYTIPEGYFEGLAEKILSKISQVTDNGVMPELAEIAPLLNTISRQPVYAVPTGYFNETDFSKSARMEKKQAKIIRPGMAKRWTQYAAAAIMAGLLITSAFLFTDNHKVALEKYDTLDMPSELNKVSEADLVTYLDNPESAPSTATEAMAEIKNTVHTLSDEELNQYLKENGDPTNIIIPVKNN